MRISIRFDEKQASDDITLICNAQRLKELKAKLLTDVLSSFVPEEEDTKEEITKE